MAKHVWILNEYGRRDDFQLDSGFHNGPGCAACGESFCQHCTDVDALDDCPNVIVVQERDDYVSAMRGSTLVNRKMREQLAEARAEIERRPEPAFRDALIADRNKAESALAEALEQKSTLNRNWLTKWDAVCAERDELARVLAGRERYENNGVNYNAIADAVLAAGYRKPVAVEGDAGELINRLRNNSGVGAASVNDRVALMDEAADLIESQAQRIRDLEAEAVKRVEVHSTDLGVWDEIAADYRRELAACRATIARVRAEAETWRDSPAGESAPTTAVGEHFLAILDASPEKGGQE